MKIIIPAREGSKGLPFKNRMLFSITANTIPSGLKNITYVCSDDSTIIQESSKFGFNTIPRPSELSQDKTSTKELMEYVHNYFGSLDETYVMLYLTYPERKWEFIQFAIDTFEMIENKSLLCKKAISWTPFLTLQEGPNNTGIKLIDHDYYRRQDYPNCFEISHFVSIFNSNEISNLNSNLYNDDTYFVRIPSTTIDVDTQKDLDKLNGRN